MFPAIFLDRDGVIIENRSDYVKSWAEVDIFPEAVAALARAAVWPVQFILVTNQSAVGRGIISLETARAINRQLVEEVQRAGGRIDHVLMCPHAPTGGCSCRKPEPGMLLDAADAHQIDLARSIMIGDALTDIAAGRRAGVRQTILLETGRGAAQRRLLEDPAVEHRPDHVFADLAAALNFVLGPHPPTPFPGEGG